MESTVAEGEAGMAPPPFAFSDSGADAPALDRALYQRFRTLIYERSGIHLGAHKEALVISRVSKRMRQLGLATFRSYYRHVTSEPAGAELVHLLDAIATNVTSFFREPQHFDRLAACVRGWHAAGQRRFRFWSAACSSGEEPYSMGMTVHDELAGRPVDLRILATDLSTRILAQATTGAFPAAKLAPVPPRTRERHFVRVAGGERFVVTAKVRESVVFRRLNLSQPPFPMRGPFDVVFCRNVMIYFDNTVRRHLLAETYRLLRPGGYLFVGHAESLTGMLGNFVSVGPAVYIKR